MAFSKAFEFEKNLHYHSMLFKALSHPARIVIIQTLLDDEESDEKTVGQIARNLPLHSKTVSQHLKVLRDLNILSYRTEYPNVFYKINKEMHYTFLNIWSALSGVREDQIDPQLDDELSKMIA